MRFMNRFSPSLFLLAVLGLAVSVHADIQATVEKQIAKIEAETPPLGYEDPGTPGPEDVNRTFQAPRITLVDGAYAVTYLDTTTDKQDNDKTLQTLCVTYQKIGQGYWEATHARSLSLVPIYRETLAENPTIAVSNDAQAWQNALNANMAERGIDYLVWNEETKAMAAKFNADRQTAFNAANARRKAVR